MERRFGSSGASLEEIVSAMAQLALGCIGKCDALYHDVEHTMLVTLAGHEILQGRAVHSPVPAEKSAYFIIACLMHDIGFVHGILEGDGQDGEVIDSGGRKITLPRGASDAALFMSIGPSRSRCSVSSQLNQSTKQRVARGIESPGFQLRSRQKRTKVMR
jgi:hypothetical protein